MGREVNLIIGGGQPAPEDKKMESTKTKFFCEQRPQLTLTLHLQWDKGVPVLSEDLQFVKGMYTPKSDAEADYIRKTDYFRRGEIKEVPLEFEPLVEPSGLPGEVVKPEDIKKLIQHVNLGMLDPKTRKALEDKARVSVKAEVEEAVKKSLASKDERIKELEAALEGKKGHRG